jgi:hypothetical protein
MECLDPCKHCRELFTGPSAIESLNNDGLTWRRSIPEFNRSAGQGCSLCLLLKQRIEIGRKSRNTSLDHDAFEMIDGSFVKVVTFKARFLKPFSIITSLTIFVTDCDIFKFINISFSVLTATGEVKVAFMPLRFYADSKFRAT